MAARANVPIKYRLDELQADEVNRIASAIDEHATELESLGVSLPLTDEHPALPTAQAAFDWLFKSGTTTGKTLRELALPQGVKQGYWYLTASGIWEAKSDFNAQASPVAGAYWRSVYSFTGTASISAAGIIDATAAGRAMLTAATAAAQRQLVNDPRIKADQFGPGHPAFSTEDGAGGAWEWVIQQILALFKSAAAAVPQPLAPTAGQVDDTADTFSFLPNPDYPSFSQYKVAGLPGVTGAVVLDSQNSYVQGSRVVVKVVGAVAKGGLAVYVAGSGNVPDGKPLLNADPFTGTAVVTPTPAAPTVTGFSPASAAAGASVTLTGTGFTGATAVLFNGTAASFQVLNATTATAIVPAQATSGPISLATSAGTGTSTASFTVAASNRIPVADAGQDLTIQLPTSRAALMGTGSDPDAGDSIASQAWRFVTGPAGVVPTGVPATTQNVVVGNLTTEGIYQFGYRTTDTHGAQSVEAYVMVTVQAAAATPPKGYQTTYTDTIPADA